MVTRCVSQARKEDNMKKLIILLPILCLLCAGCGSAKQHIEVDHRTYIGGIVGMDYGSWVNNKYTADKGAVIFSSSNPNITATISDISDNTIKIKFSSPVILDNKEGDIFSLDKNRTYVFIAGLGTEGLEIKMRFN